MIIKRHLSANFTVIDNAVLQDERLSWKATGLLAYLLSLPEDWRVHIEDLSRRKTDGHSATSSGFRELRMAGYIVVEKVRGDRGRISSVCHVYDQPLETAVIDIQNPGLTEEREIRGAVEPSPGELAPLQKTQELKTQDQTNRDSMSAGDSIDVYLSDKAKFDEVWDWLDGAFGKPTQSQNSLRAKLVRSLVGEGATKDELIRRAGTWPAHFGEATLTETALEKHWNRLGLPPRKATRAQAARAGRAQDRADLKENLE